MEYYFSEEHANRVERFFREELRFIDGDEKGQPFILQEWQRKIVRDLFGWLRPDGTRRYRMAYIEVPRKNGKSTFAAGIALYLLLCDKEARPQVYSAAGDRKQAGVVFNMARDMVRDGSDRLKELTRLRQYEIQAIRNRGWYEACSAEAYSAHGKSPHGILFDELHTQPNRMFWDALLSGRGARANSLVLAISTAGYDRQSICWEVHQRAVAAIADPDSDPTFYGVIFGAPDDADWTDEKVWEKANPNYGVSVKIDFLREECQTAKDNPAEENKFRNLYLNQWTEQAVRAIPMHCWDKNCTEKLTAEELAGEPCYVGMDLASTRDVAALVAVFPRDEGKFALLPFMFAPEDSVDPRAGQDRAKLIGFLKSGLITPTPGNETAFPMVAACFKELCEKFDVRALAYDPWNAAATVQDIVEEGFPIEQVFKFPQTAANFAEPTGLFISLVKLGKLIHSQHPVLRWMATNTACRKDVSGNLRPDKEHSADKIDGIVASIMGLARAMIGGGGGPKFYDTHTLEIG